MHIGIYYFKRTFLQTTVSDGGVMTIQVIFREDIFVGFIICPCFCQQKLILTSIQLFFTSVIVELMSTFDLNVSPFFYRTFDL